MAYSQPCSFPGCLNQTMDPDRSCDGHVLEPPNGLPPVSAPAVVFDRPGEPGWVDWRDVPGMKMVRNIEQGRNKAVQETYYVNEGPHNGPNGEPHQTRRLPSGMLTRMNYSKYRQSGHGTHDGPAYMHWSTHGRIERREFQTSKGTHNGPNGEPARLTWNGKGVLQAERHYINGIEVSGETGEWYRCNPSALAVVTETGISHEEFMLVLDQCDRDIATAVTFIHMSV